MDAVNIIDTFAKELRRAGMTPRDISPILGIHLSSLYRILSGRTATSEHALRSLQMVTVFLRWSTTCGILEDSPLELFLKWVEG